MRKSRKFLWLLAAPLMAGCGLYTVTAHFGATDGSNNAIQIRVAHKNAGPVMPGNSSATFDADVPMPTRQGSTDPVNDQTSVDIDIYDVTLGRVTASTSCMAGSNTLTNITYTVYSGGYAQVSCHNSYNRIPVKRDTLVAP